MGGTIEVGNHRVFSNHDDTNTNEFSERVFGDTQVKKCRESKIQEIVVT